MLLVWLSMVSVASLPAPSPTPPPAPSLHAQLSRVNPEWRRIAATGELALPRAFASEQALLQAHLSGVLARLRAADTHGLSAELAAARAENLARLADYLANEECPHNDGNPERVPVMVDRDGRHCPVAALMRDAGEEDFIQQVAHSDNYVRVRDIQAPRFLAWAAASGLSLDEIAWIQPAYTPETAWHVAALNAKSAPLARAEVKALPLVPGAYDQGSWTPEADELAAFLEAEHLSEADWQRRATDAGVADISDTAKPLRLHGKLHAAGSIPLDENERGYIVQRWDDGSWTTIGRFAVPIHTLFSYRGRLYAGGGRHPFMSMKDPTPDSERALITSFDGERWHRLRTKIDGEVRGFASLRGHLVAAIVHYIPPM